MPSSPPGARSRSTGPTPPTSTPASPAVASASRYRPPRLMVPTRSRRSARCSSGSPLDTCPCSSTPDPDPARVAATGAERTALVAGAHRLRDADAERVADVRGTRPPRASGAHGPVRDARRRRAASGRAARLPRGPNARPPHPLTFYDTSSYGPNAVATVSGLVGPEQLVYGSDRPVVEPRPTGLEPVTMQNGTRVIECVGVPA